MVIISRVYRTKESCDRASDSVVLLAGALILFERRKDTSVARKTLRLTYIFIFSYSRNLFALAPSKKASRKLK